MMDKAGLYLELEEANILFKIEALRKEIDGLTKQLVELIDKQRDAGRPREHAFPAIKEIDRSPYTWGMQTDE